jgi:hypothetical protein
MRTARILAVLTLTLGLLPLRAAQQAPATARYFPPAGTWEARNPGQLGLNQAKLDEAIAFAIAHEATTPKDLAQATPAQFRTEAPYNNLIGPTSIRAGSNGVIVRGAWPLAGAIPTART